MKQVEAGIQQQAAEIANVHNDLMGIQEKLNALLEAITYEERAEAQYDSKTWEFMNNVTDFLGIRPRLKEVLQKVFAPITPSGLLIKSNIDLSSWEGLEDKDFPSPLVINGFLDISHCSGVKDLPDDLRMTGDILVVGCCEHVVKKATKLKTRGQIVGKVVAKEADEKK